MTPAIRVIQALLGLWCLFLAANNFYTAYIYKYDGKVVIQALEDGFIYIIPGILIFLLWGKYKLIVLSAGLYCIFHAIRLFHVAYEYRKYEVHLILNDGFIHLIIGILILMIQLYKMKKTNAPDIIFSSLLWMRVLLLILGIGLTIFGLFMYFNYLYTGR